GVARIHAKNDFVIGIILAAETGVIFVGFGVETFHGAEASDGRCEIRVRCEGATRRVEITDSAVEGEQVVDEGDGGEEQKCVCDKRQNLSTSQRMRESFGRKTLKRKGERKREDGIILF